MDVEKKNALVEWIKAMVADAEISRLSDVKENSTILFQLLSKIDIDLQYPIGSNEKNISWVCQYLKELFNADVLDENNLQLGHELEIGKLLCLLLELTLTSSKNSDYISKIQTLPEDVQTNIMSMTKMVCDHCQKFNLGDIMQRMLAVSVIEEEDPNTDDNSHNSPVVEATLKTMEASTPVAPSPHQSCSSLNISLGDGSSPLAAFASSPQAFCRRVMIENKKLKQKVRHSELFSRRRTDFEDQLSHDVESEKKANELLLKEQDQFLQKIKDHEDTIIKLKEEVEFLQLETQSKDKEVTEKLEELKKSNDLLCELQTVVDKYSELEVEAKQKQSLLDEETRRCNELKIHNNELTDELEQQKICNENEKRQHQVEKQSFEDKERGMEQIKKDYMDQLADMQEKLSKQEKVSMSSTAEKLSDALQRDTELLLLREKHEKLRIEAKTQESSLAKISHQNKHLEAGNQKLTKDIETYKKELKSSTEKYDQSTENYKKQSNQYMDQISALLMQVQEHSQKNEGLNTKMSNTEDKYKLLERKLEKYEESQSKINEKMQQQSNNLTEAEQKLATNEMDKLKSKELLAKMELEKAQLVAKHQILTEERDRLAAIEKDHQNVIFENRRLAQVEQNNKKLTSELESLKSVKLQNQQMSTELESREVILARLQKENEQIAGLNGDLQRAKQENDRLRVFEMDFVAVSAKNEELKKIEAKFDAVQKKNDQLKSFEVQYKQSVSEISVLKTAVEEYKKSITSTETNHTRLLDEVTELRAVKFKFDELLLKEGQLKELVSSLEKAVEEKINELSDMKTTCETLQNEAVQSRQQISDLILENSVKAKETDVLQLQLQKEHTSLQQAVEKSDASAKEKEEKIDELRKSTEKQVEAFKEKLSQLGQVKDCLEEKILVFQQKQNNYENMEEKYSSLLKECETLKECKERSDAQQERMLLLREKVEELTKQEEQLIELKRTCETLENEKIALQCNKQELLEESLKKCQQYEIRISTLNALEDDYKILQQHFEELKKTNDQQMRECEQLKEKHKPDSGKILVPGENVKLEDRQTEADQLENYERDFEEKLKMQEEAFDIERESNNKTIDNLVSQVENLKKISESKDEEIMNSEAINLECLKELKSKELIIEQLENKYVESQVDQKRTTTTMRSLETQLKSSEQVIRDLKKELKSSQALSTDSTSTDLRRSKRTASEKTSKPRAVMLDSSATSEPSDEDTTVLKLAHLEDDRSTDVENKAEEIFQRSRSTRSKLRRSLIVMPSTLQDAEANNSDDKDQFSRVYSLRNKSERRRSFQPRRYMGGSTPPNRRTLIGDPMQVQMSTFNTETAEEPQVDYNWDMIQSLKSSGKEVDAMEEHRLAELQRRNTLCLPHLRSSYPMELSVDEEKNVPENVIREPNSRNKRKQEDDGPRGTYKKWKTENSLSAASDLSTYLSRSSRTTRSESNMRKGADAMKTAQSCAFEITMEPPKSLRPRLARSVASGNLKTSTEKSATATASTKTTRNVSKSNVQPESSKQTSAVTRSSSLKQTSKPESGSRFNRGDGVRNSFKSATQRVAASFRGKKISKK